MFCKLITLLTILFLQDASVEDQIQALSSKEFEKREQATVQLKKLPLENLPVLAEHWNTADPEVRVRLSPKSRAFFAFPIRRGL